MTRTRRFAVVGMLVVLASYAATPSVGAREAHAVGRAPHGYHTVKVKNSGFSVLVPNTWHVSTHEAPFDTTAYLKVAFTDVPSARLLLVLLLPTHSMPSASSLRTELGGKLKNLHVTHTKVAGVSALLAAGTTKKTTLSGAVNTVFQTVYLVRGAKGILDFNFGGRSDGQKDKTVQTMIHSVVLLH